MNRQQRRALAAQGRLSLREQVRDHLLNDTVPEEQMFLPADDRFYFPAYGMDNGIVTMAGWLKQLNVSLPRVDLVSLGEQIGVPPAVGDPARNLEFVVHGIVRFKELVDLLGDRIAWCCDRAFIPREEFPAKRWIDAHRLSVPALQGLGLFVPDNETGD